MTTVTYHHNPFTPNRDFERKVVLSGKTVWDLVPDTRQPYIAMVNGKPVLRERWNMVLGHNDVVSFVVLPQGGGGSNPLKIVMMIAVLIISIYFPPAIGLVGTEMMMASAAIGLIGTTLVNMLIPEKTPQASMGGGNTMAASPTYSLNAQGNTSRIGEAIPVQYGRHKVFPDFAAAPYVEYNGNEQYLYELFCVGLGEYDISDIKIEDTAITNFQEVTTEIINPGEQLTLFPANVETSNEVSGQKMKQNEALGPFTANKAGTTANRIAIDVVCSRGLYYVNDKGKFKTVSIDFKVEAREVDELGFAVGSWKVLGTHKISGATSTPQRRSYSYKVANGRYEVRVTRTNKEETGSSYAHEIDWTGLKAYLVDEGNTFPGMTLLAVRMRATNNISSTTSKKINLIATRRLKTWNPSTGWSTGTVPTRSIAWAFLDALKAEYGAKLDDRQIDLREIHALDAIWAARGDTFDYRFDSKSTVWEALQTIARAGRAKPYRQGGMVRIFRDGQLSVPSGMLTMQNIVKDSFSVDYLMPTEDTADAVDIEYYDNRIWQWKTVRCAMPDSFEEEPVTVRLLGVTDRDQAWREGIYMAACNVYRRRTISLTTGMEGFIPTMGDLVWVSHDMPQWGQSCFVRGYDYETSTLTVSEELNWSANATVHKIALRKRNGEPCDPIVVTKGNTAFEVVLSGPLPIAISDGMTEEPTYASFGWDETWTQPARVLSVRPSGMNKVELELVGEDDGVHLADQGIYPPEVVRSQLPGETIRPIVTGLIARSSPDDVNQAILSWNPAPWATGYDIEQSGDLETWTRAGDTTAPAYSTQVLYGSNTFFRVRGVGVATGPWVMVSYATGADYMWSADETTPMWNADETTPMWNS